MKKLILLGLVVIAFMACQQQEKRYFAESAETKTLEAGIAAYESGDWDTWRSHFADTAKIYVNSKDPITLDKRVEDLSGMTSAFSTYGFDKDETYIEMVLDKEDETWVYFWGQHSGTMKNGTKLTIPVHLAVQFADGAITEEHIYFDATEMNAALTALNTDISVEGSEN